MEGSVMGSKRLTPTRVKKWPQNVCCCCCCCTPVSIGIFIAQWLSMKTTTDARRKHDVQKLWYYIEHRENSVYLLIQQSIECMHHRATLRILHLIYLHLVLLCRVKHNWIEDMSYFVSWDSTTYTIDWVKKQVNRFINVNYVRVLQLCMTITTEAEAQWIAGIC